MDYTLNTIMDLWTNISLCNSVVLRMHHNQQQISGAGGKNEGNKFRHS